MLTSAILEQILARIGSLTIVVLGDLFLDRYLDIDPGLTEESLETGLPAYQVVRVRPSPGAAGTVINNLVALGVGNILPVSLIGDDGEGYELMQCLKGMKGVLTEHVVNSRERRTPTYTKPMIRQPPDPARELNRLDIKNRVPVPDELQDKMLHALRRTWPAAAAVLVLDQVSEVDCGVVTARIRRELEVLGQREPDKLVLVDSRQRSGMFRAVWLKPNDRECALAVHGTEWANDADACVRQLARRAGRPVFCTRGAEGIVVVDPRAQPETLLRVPAYRVTGPIDIVGAGDSCSAGIACALAAGASLGEAAAFGNLIASITIRQLGTTGTASPAQVRERLREVQSEESKEPRTK